MTVKTDIELALADLEAGKFSFRMVEAIKNHVATLEHDLANATSVQESAAKMLRQQEYTIARLEGELRKVNARVHALLKANALTETAMRETKRCALLLRDFLVVAARHVVALSRKAFEWLSTVDFKGGVEKAKSSPLAQKAQARVANFDLQAEWKKVAAHPSTEKALRALEPALAKAREYLPVAQKQLAALIEKANAFIANLNNKAA